MTRFLLALPFLIGLVAADSACAQWQFAAGTGMRYARMTEAGPGGQQLVREHGWLPGLGLRAAYLQRDWQLGMSGELYRGDLTYDGRLQNGVPFATETATGLGRIAAEIGRPAGKDSRLVGALEYERWQRNVAGRGGVAGVNERYTSWRLLAGAETRVWHWPAASVGVRGLLVLAQPEQLRVRFDHQVFDDTSLSTKPAVGLRLAFTAQPAALPNLSFALDFDWLHVKRSEDALLRKNGVATGTVAQPDHQRSALGLRAYYRF